MKLKLSKRYYLFVGKLGCRCEWLYFILIDMDVISCFNNMNNLIEFVIISICLIFMMFLFIFFDYII